LGRVTLLRASDDSTLRRLWLTVGKNPHLSSRGDGDDSATAIGWSTKQPRTNVGTTGQYILTANGDENIKANLAAPTSAATNSSTGTTSFATT